MTFRNEKYTDNFEIVRDLLMFINSIILKDERLAYSRETQQSLNSSSKFIDCITGSVVLTNNEKLSFCSRALSENYRLVVEEKEQSFVKLENEEISTYEGQRYVKDSYKRLSKEDYNMSPSHYPELFERREQAGIFLYKSISSFPIGSEFVYVSRKSSFPFKGVDRKESFSYREIYKVTRNKEYLDVAYSDSGDNNMFAFDGVDYNLRVDISNFAVMTNYNKIFNLLNKDVKLESKYFFENNIQFPINNLEELIEYDGTIYEYDGSTFSSISKNKIQLDDSFNYLMKIKYFDITLDESLTFDNIYLIDESQKIKKLTNYFTEIFVESYSDIFVKQDEKFLVYDTHTKEDFLFDIEDKSFTSFHPDIKVLKAWEICEECLSTDLEEIIGLDNKKRFVCKSCNKEMAYEELLDKKDLYVLTLSDVFLYYITTNKNVHDRFYEYKGLEINYVDFYLNNKGGSKESNEYYIELAKRGVNLATARVSANNQIVFYREGIITEKDRSIFFSVYYKELETIKRSLKNKSFEIYQNYAGLVKMMTLMSSISHFLNYKYKEILDVDLMTSREIRNVMRSFGITTFDYFPDDYLRNIIKNLILLFKNRGSDEAFNIVLDIFNSPFIVISKYFLAKDYRRNSDGNIDLIPFYTRDDLINEELDSDDTRIQTLKDIIEERIEKYGLITRDGFDNQDINALRIRSYNKIVSRVNEKTVLEELKTYLNDEQLFPFKLQNGLIEKALFYLHRDWVDESLLIMSNETDVKRFILEDEELMDSKSFNYNSLINNTKKSYYKNKQIENLVLEENENFVDIITKFESAKGIFQNIIDLEENDTKLNNVDSLNECFNLDLVEVKTDLVIRILQTIYNQIREHDSISARIVLEEEGLKYEETISLEENKLNYLLKRKERLIKDKELNEIEIIIDPTKNIIINGDLIPLEV